MNDTIEWIGPEAVRDGVVEREFRLLAGQSQADWAEPGSVRDNRI